MESNIVWIGLSVGMVVCVWAIIKIYTIFSDEKWLKTQKIWAQNWKKVRARSETK